MADCEAVSPLVESGQVPAAGVHAGRFACIRQFRLRIGIGLNLCPGHPFHSPYPIHSPPLA